MTETPKETIWILTPRMQEYFSKSMMANRKVCNMVEVSLPAETDYPQALIHVDCFDGDISRQLHKGRTVTVKLIDISQED
jgi:hypothetical protein